VVTVVAVVAAIHRKRNFHHPFLIPNLPL